MENKNLNAFIPQRGWALLRTDATLTVTDLTINKAYIPKGATYYRVQNHLSIISDYLYNDANRRYEPLSLLNGKSAFKYSAYTPIGTSLTEVVKASFPVDTLISDDASVVQCVGLEFYVKAGADTYVPLQGNCMMVADVY